ncbi:MAG: hypothetical protein ACTS6G_00570 [Candidatus Hodgkinia cicadicola]
MINVQPSAIVLVPQVTRSAVINEIRKVQNATILTLRSANVLILSIFGIVRAPNPFIIIGIST